MLALKALRCEKGLTQRQVADVIGVTATAITQYESGDREPNLDKLKKLAVLFNCTIDELVNGKTKKKVIVRRRKTHV